MAEITPIVHVEQTTALVAHAAAIKAMLSGVGALVALTPATLALVENGMQVQATLDKLAPDIEQAESIIIDSPDMLQDAAELAGRLAAAAADSGSIEAERKALTKPFNDLVSKINGGYNPARAHVALALAGADGKSGLKAKILAYHNAVAAEAARLEKAARQKREQEAREAAEVEAATTTKASALIAEATEAQAAGCDIAAAALASEASVVIDSARQAATTAMQSLHSNVCVAPVARASGVRGTYGAVCDDKRALVLHIAARVQADDDSLLSLLDVNEKGLKAKGKLEGQGFKLPGCRSTFEQGLAVRKSVAA